MRKALITIGWTVAALAGRVLLIALMMVSLKAIDRHSVSRGPQTLNPACAEIERLIGRRRHFLRLFRAKCPGNPHYDLMSRA